MKIALACHVYPTQRPGGMGYVCQDRARALVELGHDVHVLTTGRETHHGEELDDHGVSVHHMPCKPETKTDAFAANCEKHCRSFLPDIVHSDSLDMDRPWWKSLPKETTTAITLHGFCWGSYFTKWNLYYRSSGSPPSLNPTEMVRERELFLTFNRIIGISRHEHWMLADLLNIFDARLVYNPIADYFFKDIVRDLPSGKRRLLCAAVSGQRERGFDIAERAVKGIDAELVVVKNVPREKMPAVIDSCHALVLPTAYSQGCDLAVAEAIVRHRPVIVTATGSYRRETEKGGIYEGGERQTAILRLVPLTDTDALADAMIAPLTDLDWRWHRSHLHGAKIHAAKWLDAIVG